MVIDEGSRFRVGRILLEGSGKLHAPATKSSRGSVNVGFNILVFRVP